MGSGTKSLFWAVCVVTFLLPSICFPQFTLKLEGSPLWQSRNEIQIPPSTGTRFNLIQASTGPFAGYRIYAGYDFNERHGVRVLFAPLSVSATGTFAENIDFVGKTYVAGTSVTGTYQFNSYRLTYRYLFFLSDDWKLHIGFTGKIRDAKISLIQGTTSSESKNVGFVPLLHFAAAYQFSESWRMIFDFDGLMAPQGRAFDVTAQLGWQLNPLIELSLGYRTVEGGASNSTTFNFAWFHFLVFGAQARF